MAWLAAAFSLVRTCAPTFRRVSSACSVHSTQTPRFQWVRMESLLQAAVATCVLIPRESADFDQEAYEALISKPLSMFLESKKLIAPSASRKPVWNGINAGIHTGLSKKKEAPAEKATVVRGIDDLRVTTLFIAGVPAKVDIGKLCDTAGLKYLRIKRAQRALGKKTQTKSALVRFADRSTADRAIHRLKTYPGLPKPLHVEWAHNELPVTPRMPSKVAPTAAEPVKSAPAPVPAAAVKPSRAPAAPAIPTPIPESPSIDEILRKHMDAVAKMMEDQAKSTQAALAKARAEQEANVDRIMNAVTARLESFVRDSSSGSPVRSQVEESEESRKRKEHSPGSPRVAKRLDSGSPRPEDSERLDSGSPRLTESSGSDSSLLAVGDDDSFSDPRPVSF